MAEGKNVKKQVEKVDPRILKDLELMRNLQLLKMMRAMKVLGPAQNAKAGEKEKK